MTTLAAAVPRVPLAVEESLAGRPQMESGCHAAVIARPGTRGFAQAEACGSAYQIGPVAVTIHADEARLLDDFHALYAAYDVPMTPPSALHVEVVRRRSPRTWRRTYHIGVDGEERFVVASPRAVLPHVEWAINAAAVSTLSRFFQVHAAVVAREGAAMMLPAAPQCGKSTLAAGLMQRGWRYLSDEFALIDPATLHVFPFPKALCIKHGSFERIERLGLSFSSERDYLKGIKGRVRFVDPNQLGPGAVGDPAPVRWIVFPVEVGAARPRLERISRARAVYEMARVSFTLTRFRGRSLEVLAALASRAECFVLHGGDLPATCDAIEACVLAQRRHEGTEEEGTKARRHEGTKGRDQGSGIGDQGSGTGDQGSGIGSQSAIYNPQSAILPIPHSAFRIPHLNEGRRREAIMRGVAGCLTGRADMVTQSWHSLGLWDRAACLACDAGLGGFLAESLERQGVPVPPSAAETLAAYRDHVAAQNAYQEARMGRVLDALRDAGVDVLVLKGAALNASLYLRRGLRGMSDVDLLIHSGDLRPAEAALADAGCRGGREGVRPGFFPRFYYEREFLTGDHPPVRVDLHVRPFRPIRYAATVPADALWDNPQPAVVGDARVLIPSRENMLIHLCVHAACHGLVHLRWLHDIHAFVKAYGQSLNWDEVETKAKAWRVNLSMRRALEAVRTTFAGWHGLAQRRVASRSQAVGVANVTSPGHENLMRVTTAWLGDAPHHCARPCHPAGTTTETYANRACTIEDAIRRFDAPVTFLDRLALDQSPHDAIRPVRHILTDVLCLGGVRARWDYLAATLLPDRRHIAEWYGGRHRGWRVVAHGLRLLRPLQSFWRRENLDHA